MIKRLLTQLPWLTMTLCNMPVMAELPAANTPDHGEYQDWRLIGISHRLDKSTMRAIVGNDVAIKAVRESKTSPWPDGTILAKLVWQEKRHPNWPQAVIPGNMEKAEAMVKDSKKYAETGGWGFGRWEGKNLLMNDAVKSAACYACHLQMKDRDFVFTFTTQK